MRYLHRFTLLGWEANAQLDSGAELDPDEVRKHVEDGTLIEWIDERFDTADMSLYEAEDPAETCRVLDQIWGGVNLRRKFGVERNGLAIIVALCLQAIQGGEENYAEE